MSDNEGYVPGACAAKIRARGLDWDAAKRKAEERKRRAAEGLTRLEVYANPADHQQIKTLAEKLRKRRAKAKELKSKE